jgi:phosphotransferase system enzyme I (PtsI)
MEHVIYSGTVISSGMARAKAFNVGLTRLETIPYTSIREEEVESEKEKLWVAIEISISELQSLMKRIKVQIGERESRVFEVHITMLRDRHISARMVDRIDFEKINAETAVVRTVSEMIQSFRGHGKELREKFSSDFRDLGLRLIKNLSPFFTYDKAMDLIEPVILVARELTPSVAVRLDRKWIKGFVVEEGNPTTHAGILVRSMGVAAISGVQDYFHIKNDDQLFLDGRVGKVLVNPGKKAQEIFEKSYMEYQSTVHEVEKLTDVEPATKDHHAIKLLANIWLPGDLEMAQAIGAQGVGLIRTEFIYLFQNKPPREEDVYQYYKGILEKVWTGPANFRLLDVGGEMELPKGLFKEGVAQAFGLKFLLEEKELLKVQFRSILKASAAKPAGIVYPFFDSLEELKHANQILDDVKHELLNQKSSINTNVNVGALIETLEAVDQIDSILDAVSFVILGSNDLILRCLGLDRQAKIDLSDFKFVTPSFLKMVLRVLDACHQKRCAFYFSGQMAEDPLHLGLLMGMGIQNFNLASSSIPSIKRWMASVQYADLSRIAKHALSIQEEEVLRKFLQKELHLA